MPKARVRIGAEAVTDMIEICLARRHHARRIAVMSRDLIETGLSPNYVRVRSPGGAGIRVENPGGTREVSATFLVEWREFVD